MTSCPDPGLQDSLQGRGSSSTSHHHLSKAVHAALPIADLVDPELEDDRLPQHHEPLHPPPCGRPQLFYTTVASNGIELPIHAFPHQPTASLPVPPRPGSIHLGEAAHQHRIVPGGSGVKDAPKLAAPEPAAVPVHFLDGTAADVFPWTGDNAEDTLTEALVKGGISNKPQIMNETNTARPSLWSSLKNKSGINSLTSLFVAVLEKRQQSGRLVAPNSFKPPPRLTLRDSTRENWLHDLANPTANMRRLSRTIPHGLTGKVLLEQCLNKNVPHPKAVWLAKCVGINELRAHKRKGHAGTATWSRGWTNSVEQFLDSIVSTIGQGDWKPRMTYSLQLATYFYRGNLLDADHFLNWILNGLDSCSPERLFIWILVVSSPHYWRDIASCRRRGKQLAECLLGHLAKLYQHEDSNPSWTLIPHLENALSKLLTTWPACLLLPSSWERHTPILHRLAAKRNHLQKWVENLDMRNRRLSQSVVATTFTAQTPVARVYRKLDSLDYNAPIRIDDISYEMLETLADATQLVSALMQWACSCYREGSHRIYLSVRLLRRWSHMGADVYEAITSYFRSMVWAQSGEPRVLYRIVAELVRSKHFSAGRYLQWLIATGSLCHNIDFSSNSSWPVRLITEIPISGLSDQVRNLRCTLLRGTLYSAESEGQALHQAKNQMVQAIPALFGYRHTGVGASIITTQGLSPTVRLELGIWLRQRVATHSEVNEHVPTKEPGVEEIAAVSLITTQDFHVIRNWLEQFGDLAILADIVGIAASSLDATVLATVADTLNYHFKAFRAIGALDPLFNRIEMRYAAIRTIRYPDRELLVSLQSLARNMQSNGQVLQLLSYDLSRLDQKNSIAACSPASDSMGEAMQQAGACSDDEVERILLSGTSMDQQMMARVFKKIISNLQDHVAKGYLQCDNYPTWFWRLRNFDEPAFDIVVQEWLSSCLMSHQLKSIQLALPFLVSAGCTSLARFLDELRAFITRSRDSQLTETTSTAVSALRVLLNSQSLVQTCSPQDAYRFRMEQYNLCHGHDSRILHTICDIIDLVSSAASPQLHEASAAMLSSSAVVAIMKHHLVTNPTCFSDLRTKKANQHSNDKFLRPLLINLLDPLRSMDFAKKSAEEQVVTIFKAADDLSLPICRALIDCTFSVRSSSTDALSSALFDAVRLAVEENRAAGLQLLAALDRELTNQIRQHAEQEILNASAFLVGNPTTRRDDMDRSSASVAQKHLKVVRLTLNKHPELSDPAAMLSALADRFRGISVVLSGSTSVVSNTAGHDRLSPEVSEWLDVLLNIAMMHSSRLLLHASVSHQCTLMATMKSLLTHPALEVLPGITEYIFDVAVYLSDFMTNDARIQTARNDNISPVDDPRCHFLMGIAAPVDGWLAVTKPSNVPPNSQNTSQPTTPSTSQNQGSPFDSLQMSSSGPATSQQRHFNHQQQQQQQQQQTQTQTRAYPQSSQTPALQSRAFHAQMQRASSNPTPVLQQMQQMQGLAQQRATQPAPAHPQRPALAANTGSASGSSSVSSGKVQSGHSSQQTELKQYPFTQPRWELLADTSAHPDLNETSISLSLFGARKV